MTRALLIFLAGLLLGGVLVYGLSGRGPLVAVSASPDAKAAAPKAEMPAAAGELAAVAADRRAPATLSLPASAAADARPAPGPAAAKSPTGSAARDRVAAAAPPAPSGLLLPVVGVTADQLSDTYHDTRGGTRIHEALDIMAPRGTEVVAAVDGKVEKLFTSKAGGLTVYQFDPQRTHAYYYAHLDAYAPGLREGQALRRGDPVGVVGSTGNASADAPHLHFAIFLLGPEKHWWEGTPIDPYPLLKPGAAKPAGSKAGG